MEPQQIKVCEFFSGIGGWLQALRKTDKCSSIGAVRAFDINTVCNQVYLHNYHSTPCPKTIEALREMDVAANLWVMSPPCQPHTRNNTTESRDTTDPRSRSFTHLVELLRTMHEPPQFIALENVVGFESSDCCQLWREVMRERGYSMLEFHLTPSQFGVPNERPRYYSLSSRGTFRGFPAGVSGEILTYIPGHNAQESIRPLSAYMQRLTAQESQELKLSDEVLEKSSSWCMDIATSEDTSSSCFTKSYGRYAKGTGSVLYTPSEEAPSDTSEQKQELTNGKRPRDREDADEAEGVRKKREMLLEDPSERKYDEVWHQKYTGRLRYFSPRELLNLFGFDEDFTFPAQIARRKQYEMIGNSLNAAVAGRLLQFLFDSHEEV